MGFVAAKCTQCGGDIEVDSSKEAGICAHCGTAFITEKAINNYNNTYNIQNANFNVSAQNGDKINIVHISQQDLWKNQINERLVPLKGDIKYTLDPRSNEGFQSGCVIFVVGAMFLLPIFKGGDALLVFGLLVLVSAFIAYHLSSPFTDARIRIQKELASIKSINSNLEFEKMVDKLYSEFVEFIKKEKEWK